MWAIVNCQANLFAGAFGEIVRKFENVSNSGATEAVEWLIVIADDANILGRRSKKEQDSFLDCVCVLVLIYHKVAELGLKVLKDFGMIFQQVESFGLNRWEIEGIFVREQSEIGFRKISDGLDVRVWRSDEGIGVETFFEDFVEVAEDFWGFAPLRDGSTAE